MGRCIAQLAIAVLGVLCVSSEYWSGMIRASLIPVPKPFCLSAFGHEGPASSEHDDVPSIGQVCDRVPNRQPGHTVLGG